MRFSKFKILHPVCCFCGGDSPTESRDHQPPEKLYPEGRRPEGFLFPACNNCNNSSSNGESKLTLILWPEGMSEDLANYRIQTDGFAKYRPQTMLNMQLTNREKRNHLSENGLLTSDGDFLDQLPLQHLPHQEWRSILDTLAQKMVLAMHYRYFGEPLPKEGRIVAGIETNFAVLAGNVPQWMAMLFDKLPPDNRCVTDDFYIAHGREGDVGLYAIAMRSKIFIAGCSCADGSKLPHPDALGPLNHIKAA